MAPHLPVVFFFFAIIVSEMTKILPGENREIAIVIKDIDDHEQIIGKREDKRGMNEDNHDNGVPSDNP